MPAEQKFYANQNNPIKIGCIQSIISRVGDMIQRFVLIVIDKLKVQNNKSLAYTVYRYLKMILKLTPQVLNIVTILTWLWSHRFASLHSYISNKDGITHPIIGTYKINIFANWWYVELKFQNYTFKLNSRTVFVLKYLCKKEILKLQQIILFLKICFD